MSGERSVHTYAEAGVDIAAGEQAVALMRPAIERGLGSTVVSRFGAFGAAVRSPGAGTLLISSTDGVGTKTCLVDSDQEAAGIGRDLVHHSINDILTCGARPFFFLDYLAFARLEPRRAAAIVSGMAAACAAHGCALVGGETAEMPGVYQAGAFDVAGCMVGTVAEQRFIDGSAVRVSDALIGLPSTGLHTNGYSLARALLGGRLQESLGDGTVRQALLQPHRCYLPDLAPLIEAGEIRGLAHITGGGLPGNLPRMLRPGLGASLRPDSWPSQPIFDLLRGCAVPMQDLFSTFNMGLGMVVACSAARREQVLAALGQAYCIGEVVAVDGPARVLGL